MPRPSRRESLLSALVDAGGIADGAQLIAASSRPTLRAAVADAVVVRIAMGTYALPGFADPGLAARGPARAWSRWKEGPSQEERRLMAARVATARSMKAALSHRCAAEHHGWPVLRSPDALDVVVPHGRSATHGAGATKSGTPIRRRRRQLSRLEWQECVTSPIRTVLDCARELPFAEALAVADSALRSGAVGATELADAADHYRGPGQPAVSAVAARADAGAANPFESTLRAVVGDLFDGCLETQYVIADAGFEARVDLADPGRRIVLEADSYEFHGSLERFIADRRRYAELTCRGWLVLPFAFRPVMTDATWVRSIASATLLTRARQVYPAA